jgi:hypothetical protein
MRFPRSTRALALVVSLAHLVLTAPSVASAQPRAPGSPELAPEVRDRIVQAAGDTMMPPWQRDYMLRLARGDEGAAPRSTPRAAQEAQAGSALDTAACRWTNILTNSRSRHSSVYDPVRDRMIVFGGTTSYCKGFSNDVWALSLAGPPEWTLLAPTGSPPAKRADQSAIYDPVRDRMIVFGGRDDRFHYNDVYALSLAGAPLWTTLNPLNRPQERAGQSAIYDPVRDRMIVFGGERSGSNYNDVWTLVFSGPLPVRWVSLSPTGTPPSGRQGQSAIYDPARDRMVVFGGGDSPLPDSLRNDVWALSFGGTPAWTALTPTGTPPPGQQNHSAVYDPSRDRMIVFRGLESSSSGDTAWALSFSGGASWTALVPAGTWLGQAKLRCHTAIYDSLRDRVVIFGGESYDYALCSGGTWALSLAPSPNWTTLTTPNSFPPEPRCYQSVIYDPIRDRILMFGGSYLAATFADDFTYTLSLAVPIGWGGFKINSGPVLRRSDHSAIYDPVRDRMLLFGGTDGTSKLNDTWGQSLDGMTPWTTLAPLGQPPSRRAGHSAIYDPLRDRMIVFGGADSAGSVNDVWALSLAGVPEWTLLAPTGTPPSARYGHGAIYDPVRDRMVVFGGYGGAPDTSYTDRVWFLSLTGTPAWTTRQLNFNWWRWLGATSTIYDPVRDRMLVFGGACGGSYLNNVVALSLSDPQAWTTLAPLGQPPSGRAGHSAIYDPVRDRMVIYGGGQGNVGLNDVWSLWMTNVVSVSGPETRPTIGSLRPPSPNPTSGATTLSYSIAQRGPVRIGVYDVSGRLVRRLVNSERRAGAETVTWDGTNDSGEKQGAGLYFVLLVAPETRVSRRVVLLK